MSSAASGEREYEEKGSKMKRSRYLQLAVIADEICVLLSNKGVKPNEGCAVRRIAESQWDAMRASYNEIERGLAGQVTETCVPQGAAEGIGWARCFVSNDGLVLES